MKIFPSNVSLPNDLLFGKAAWEGGGGAHVDNNLVRKAIFLFLSNFEFWKMNLPKQRKSAVWTNWLMKWCRNNISLKKMKCRNKFFARSWLQLNDLCESFFLCFLISFFACFYQWFFRWIWKENPTGLLFVME